MAASNFRVSEIKMTLFLGHLKREKCVRVYRTNPWPGWNIAAILWFWPKFACVCPIGCKASVVACSWTWPSPGILRCSTPGPRVPGQTSPFQRWAVNWPQGQSVRLKQFVFFVCMCVYVCAHVWISALWSDLPWQGNRTETKRKVFFFFHSLSGSLLLCVLQAELGWLNRTNPSEGWHPQRKDFKALLICFDLNIKMLWEKQKYSKAVFSWQPIAHMSLFLVLVCVSSSSHCFLLNGKMTLGLSFFPTEILVFLHLQMK